MSADQKAASRYAKKISRKPYNGDEEIFLAGAKYKERQIKRMFKVYGLFKTREKLFSRKKVKP